jgi:dienelactone hydrolase
LRCAAAVAAVFTVLAAASGCGGADPAAPDPLTESERVLAHLTISGSPEGTTGATWAYRDTVDGVIYELTGVLFKPAGAGPFPAVIVSHGAGGSATNYSRNVGATIARWGAVVIATNYTHAVNGPAGAPGGTNELGGSAANVQRARRLAELLRALRYVDMTRLAAHGHSMGAFVTAALAATHPTLLRAASHTAGGVRADAVAGPAPSETQGRSIRTPYQMHHGDRDLVVLLAADERLRAALVAAGTTHELNVYEGADHDDVAFNTAVLDRVRAWYTRHGVF